MTSRRALLALAFVGAASPALLQAGCASLVGVDVGSLDDVVADMCGCPDLDSIKKTGACESTLTARLAAAGPTDRAAWLTKYDQECATCPGVLACLGERPACSIDACTITEECCQTAGAIKKTCNGGHCGEPQ